MRTVTLLCALTVGSLACADVPSPTEPRTESAPQLSSGSCGGGPLYDFKFSAAFACNDVIGIVVTGSPASGDSTAIVAGSRDLNTSLAAATYGLPRFSQTEYNVTVTALVIDSADVESNVRYCGHAAVDMQITIYRLDTGDACPKDPNALEYPTLQHVAAHELAHIYGWDHFDGTDPQLNPCVMNITPTTIHSSYCALEKQVMYYAFGLRRSAPRTDRHLITGVAMQLQGSATMLPGEQRTLTASAECGGATSTAAGLDGVASSGDCDIVPDVVWQVSNTSVLQIMSQNDTMVVVKALSVSSTTSAMVIARLPVAPETVWPEQADTQQLTVSASQPAVKSVTLSPNPVTTEPGGTIVTGTARDRDGNVISGVTFTWSILDTRIATMAGPGPATDGHVCGLQAGTTTVTATASNGVSGSAQVNVPKDGTGCW